MSGLSHLHAEIAAALAPHGLHPRGFARFPGGAGGPLLDDGRSACLVLLIGNVGGSMWRPFCDWRAAEPGRAGANPLDNWSKAVIGAIAAGIGATAFYPSDPPYQPFQRWAMLAEGLKASRRLGVCRACVRGRSQFRPKPTASLRRLHRQAVPGGLSGRGSGGGPLRCRGLPGVSCVGCGKGRLHGQGLPCPCRLSRRIRFPLPGRPVALPYGSARPASRLAGCQAALAIGALRVAAAGRAVFCGIKAMTSSARREPLSSALTRLDTSIGFIACSSPPLSKTSR